VKDGKRVAKVVEESKRYEKALGRSGKFKRER